MSFPTGQNKLLLCVPSHRTNLSLETQDTGQTGFHRAKLGRATARAHEANHYLWIPLMPSEPPSFLSRSFGFGKSVLCNLPAKLLRSPLLLEKDTQAFFSVGNVLRELPISLFVVLRSGLALSILEINKHKHEHKLTHRQTDTHAPWRSTGATRPTPRRAQPPTARRRGQLPPPPPRSRPSSMTSSPASAPELERGQLIGCARHQRGGAGG